MASPLAPIASNQKFPCPSTLNVANFISVKLSQTNFLLWKTQVFCLIESQDLQGFINGEVTAPDQFIITGSKQKTNPTMEDVRSTPTWMDHRESGRVIAEGQRLDDLYVFVAETKEACFSNRQKVVSLEIWHRRLVHVNFGILKFLNRQNQIYYL
ncbi:uncharacterized protein LOC126409236 [Nymphaea colorata]|uniref:uncharacterized protein LOC126409236 n=1 Tax=Nymphaea colorata TaxID=210225 RepID=UPI00214DFC2F|nr:uncharacterized protein LOC126409236 [Nymphaea colorata]